MKNKIKIIVVNIVVILIIIIFAEMFLFINDYFHTKQGGNIKNFKEYISFMSGYFKQCKDEFVYIAPKDVRKPVIKDNNLPSVVLMGCSYTYGYNLDDNDTFHYILSEQTNRSVYNLGISGGSPREMLYLMQNDTLRNEILNGNDKAEYVIFTYIQDHKRRLYYDVRLPSPHFKHKNNELQFTEKHKLIYFSQIYRKIKSLQYRIDKNLFKDKTFDLFCLYMRNINKEIENKFSNNGEKTKFVILVYNDKDKNDWSKLNDENIIILNVNDITQTDMNALEYKISETDIHPNRKAWETIVPALIKELNLN